MENEILSANLNYCFGINNLKIEKINFSNKKAILYAPNGLMKTSFAKTFKEIKQGKKPKDNFCPENDTTFTINCLGHKVNEKSSLKNLKKIPVFVINSFEEDYESNNISSLLVDNKLRKRYEKIIKTIEESKDNFLKKLKNFSGISNRKNKQLSILYNDFEVNINENLIYLFDKIHKNLKSEEPSNKEEFTKLKYNDLINKKTIKIIKNKNFIKNIDDYLDTLNELINKSQLLNSSFDNYNALELKKGINKNNLFKVGHKILLNNNKKISNIKEFDEIIKAEIKNIAKDSKLKNKFEDIENNIAINNNEQGRVLKKILRNNKFLISQLYNVDRLKKILWICYILKIKDLFYDLYNNLKKSENEISKILNTARNQRTLWQSVIEQFKERFNVPFDLQIENKKNVLLENQVPQISFKHTDSTRPISRDKLLGNLSMGEKRAFYLLQILFDIENLKEKKEKVLLIFDDIVDSFDYKNKYAIIEYFNELSHIEYFYILILTHNFDFYRTVSNRIDINYNVAYLVENTNSGLKLINKLGYRKNIFRHYLEKFNTHDKTEYKKYFIVSIPFFREIDNILDKDIGNFLTKILHIKEDSKSLTFGEVHEELKKIKNDIKLHDDVKDECIIESIYSISNNIVENNFNNNLLLNKLILSIAIRLKCEEFMLDKYEEEIEYPSKNQTRELYKGIKDNLNKCEKKIVKKVLLVTPENIHLNAFMFEPIIDISDWHLKKIFNELKKYMRSYK